MNDPKPDEEGGNRVKNKQVKGRKYPQLTTAFCAESAVDSRQ